MHDKIAARIAFRRTWLELLPAGLTWGAAWWLLFWLDGRVNLANQALLLVLAAALASLWLPLGAAVLVSLGSVLLFNWHFVSPRGSLTVEGNQHLLLLVAMLGLSCITALLIASQRRQAALARRQAGQAEQLRAFNDRLREARDWASLAPLLQAELQAQLGTPVHLMLLHQDQVLPQQNLAEAVQWLGAAGQSPAADLSADQTAGLWQSLRQAQAFGPGTARFEGQPDWYLPIRGRGAALGAALLQPSRQQALDAGLLNHLQLLCTQMGLALERLATEHLAQLARDEAASQANRNALLAAISHDFRTPLACIMGAASALQDQDARLSPAQRARLTATILDETEALADMTANSLQLARLDAPGVSLRLDWESAEEIVGAVLRRARQRRATLTSNIDGEAALELQARLEPALPLLRCDALLLTQLLGNLVDNAQKYAPASQIEIAARTAQEGGQRFVVLAVLDRGPGVPLAWRERIFEAFQRGAEQQHAAGPDANARRGAGVGLAACRAIAQAHGGQMRYRSRRHGGASFECWLPLNTSPQAEDMPA
jgi:two-component system sensor histidine kinase KdpD